MRGDQYQPIYIFGSRHKGIIEAALLIALTTVVVLALYPALIGYFFGPKATSCPKLSTTITVSSQTSLPQGFDKALAALCPRK